MTVDLTNTEKLAPPPRGWRPAFWFLVRAGVSVGVLAFAWTHVDRGVFAATIDFPLLGAAVAALLAATVLAAARWSFLTRPDGPIAFARAAAITFAGQFVGQVLPSSVGQDAVRAVLATRGDPAKTVSLIALDRLCGLFGLSALVFAGLPRLAELGGLARGGEAAFAASGLVTATLIAALLARLLSAPRFLPAALRNLWEAMRSGAKQLTSLKGLIATVAAMGGQALVTLSFWLIARAIGAPLSLLDAFATVPPAMFMAMLPLSVNGWGVREGAMVLSLGFAGVSAGQAFLASVLFGIALLATSLPGAVTLMILRRRA